MLWLFALIAGILFGLYYALAALGLNLIFGVMRMVNLAHGDVIMLGGFAAVLLFDRLGINPLITVLLVIPPSLLVGFVAYYLLGTRVQGSRDPEMMSLVMFFGVSQVVEALAVIGFGNNEASITSAVFGSKPFSIAGQGVPGAWLVSAGVGLAALILLFVYLYHTGLGRATRAIMSNADEARAVGVNPDRISAITFGIGVGLAAIAGIFSLFMIGGTTPSEGVGLTVTAFAVIVIGGLGSPMGTFLGGIVFGLALMFTQTYAPVWSGFAPFAILLVIMLVRPTGLMGRSVRSV